MLQTKKTIVMLLVSALLGGGAWYLNTSGVISSISSSALSTPFVCSESALSSQAKLYKTTVSRKRKALVMQRSLEKEIADAVKSSSGEATKKQASLKVLKRQILLYNRFIGKYEICKKEIKLLPTVSTGMMSGEAKVAVSDKEYQALAAFRITSPNGLNTYINTIQFKIETNPVGSVTVDKWFLLHEGADPIPCYQASGSTLIECELSGNIPVDIATGTDRTYAIGAHIISLGTSGTLDIQISNISFNDGRTTSETSITPKVLTFGAVAAPVRDASPSPVKSISVETVPSVPSSPIVTPPTDIGSSSGVMNPAVVPVVTPEVTSSQVIPEATVIPEVPSTTDVLNTLPTPSEILPVAPTSETQTTPPPSSTATTETTEVTTTDTVTAPSSDPAPTPPAEATSETQSATTSAL